MFSFLLSIYRVLKLLSHIYHINLLRNYQTVFQSSCTFLHFHQQFMSVPTSLYLCQHLLLLLFDSSHSSGCEVVSHCFDLHFPMTNDVDVLTNDAHDQKSFTTTGIKFFGNFRGSYPIKTRGNILK